MKDEQQEQSNNRPWLFQKGQSGNPSGRKKGTKSLKSYAQDMIKAMDDDERQKYLDGLPKGFIWEMAEGKAQSSTDITSGGEPIKVNIVSYGNNITPQLPTETIPASDSPVF